MRTSVKARISSPFRILTLSVAATHCNNNNNMRLDVRLKSMLVSYFGNWNRTEVQQDFQRVHVCQKPLEKRPVFLKMWFTVGKWWSFKYLMILNIILFFNDLLNSMICQVCTHSLNTTREHQAGRNHQVPANLDRFERQSICHYYCRTAYLKLVFRFLETSDYSDMTL